MRELVLTGIKDFWPQDESSALFLGPWCFAHHHEYRVWDCKRFPLAPSPYKTPADVLQASRYVDTLVDRVAPVLARVMNDLHRLTLSDRFWRSLLAVWLVHWLGVAYDRYLRLESVEKECEEEFTVRVLTTTGWSIRDVSDLIDKISHHYYNLLLLSNIISLTGFRNLAPVPGHIDETASLNGKVSFAEKFHEPARQLRDWLRQWYVDHLDSPVYLGNISGLSWVDRFKLTLQCSASFRIFPKRGRFTTSEGCPNDLQGVSFSFGATNRFESSVEKMILTHLPSSLLSIRSPTGPTQIRGKLWVGNDIHEQEKYACRIACIREPGGKWISSQHGGGYGQFLSFPVGKVEYDASDGFITWGWSFEHIYPTKLHPLPSPMLSKLPKHTERKGRLIFVGTMHPAYLYRLHSALLPDVLPDYLEAKRRFLQGLSETIRAKVMYRPYFNDYGTAEREFVRQLLPAGQFLEGKHLTKHLQTARLVVIDHLSTGLLQTFVMNTPTILFWHPDHFAVTAEARGHFDALRTAGILFDQPEAAADKVNEVWRDVGRWWKNTTVQRAREDFCQQFARSSPRWLEEWSEFLREMSRTDG